MSVSWKKLKVVHPDRAAEVDPGAGNSAPGRDHLSVEEIVAYVTEPQPGGDYYSEAGKAWMMWHVTPRAAVLLGIAQAGQRASQQQVLPQTLGQLIAGRNPVTGKFVRRAGPDGTFVGAIDLTMSPAPKSVSILWALASPQLRYELELMVAKASDRAVTRMLREQPFVRPRSSEHVVADDWVAASALHTTARMSASGRGVPDPQLHLHYLLIGAVDERGQLRALDSKVLADYQAELEAEASGHLAELLRERGFEIERRLVYRQSGRPRVAWEVVGVPPSLIEAMSSRTREIEDLKRQFMREYGREPVGRAWEAWIVRQRGPKGKFTSSELRWEWTREAVEHGLTPADVDELLANADLRRAMGVPRRTVDSPQAQEFRELLLAHVCRDHAFVTKADLTRLAHQLAPGLIPALEVDFVIGRMFGEGDLVLLKDDRLITTLEV